MIGETPQRDKKSGRWVSGNNGGGRPKGSKNRFSLTRAQLLEDLGAAWTKHRRLGVLDRLAEESPKDFVKCCISILPRDNLTMDVELGPTATKVIEDLTAFVRDYRLVKAAREAIGAEPLMIECMADEDT
jgi:hypothetical protein